MALSRVWACHHQQKVEERREWTKHHHLRKLIADDRWKEGDAVYGIPKVRVTKISMKKKKKVKKEDEEDSK